VAQGPDPLDPRSVHDRASFLAFIRALAADYRTCAPYGRMASSDHLSPFAGLWHSLDLGEFLDAGVAWVEQLGSADTDFPGPASDFPAEPSWSAFARFLFLCKSYYPRQDS
jgi:hypothetical protein